MGAPVNIHYAKTHLSRLLEQVEAGEEVVIARAGKPVARLVPLPKPRRREGRDSLKGILKVDWDAWDALDEEIAREFYEAAD